jgi:opacity protein-like surface antigen
MITKKSYITGIAIVILTSSVLAEDRTGLYFKANVGANKINKTKEKNFATEEKIYLDSNKSKSKVSPVFNIAAGFYLNNFVRHDLSFGYQKVNFEKSVINFNIYDNDEDLNYIGTSEVNRKSSIYSLMFNSYIDLPISNNINFFFGGGIGLAQIKENLNQKWNTAAFQQNNFIGSNIDKHSFKSKNRRNFAYSLTTGISLKVSDKANFEVTYSWQDFGKTKYKDKDVTKNRYNGHSIMTGLRFDV